MTTMLTKAIDRVLEERERRGDPITDVEAVAQEALANAPRGAKREAQELGSSIRVQYRLRARRMKRR